MEGSTFFLLGNIPPSFHSVNLRDHFSHFVEGGRFRCFHYRHRPEEHYHHRPEEHYQRVNTQVESMPPISYASSSSSSFSGTFKKGTHCCIVAVVDHFGNEFVEQYHSKNWSKSDGGLLPGKVRVSKLNVTMAVTKEGLSMTGRFG